VHLAFLEGREAGGMCPVPSAPHRAQITEDERPTARSRVLVRVECVTELGYSPTGHRAPGTGHWALGKMMEVLSWRNALSLAHGRQLVRARDGISAP
jgi:hypothetical protein